MTEFNDPLSKRTEIAGIPFADLASMPEHERIIAMGNFLKDKPAGYKMGCLVDEEGPAPHHEKADRCIRTMLSLFPNVKADKHKGPVPGVILIHFYH